MANPVVVECPAGAITKVATNVVTGNIRKIAAEKGAIASHSYRLTGEPEPTEKIEFALAFCDCVDEPISATAPIDVYIYASGGKVTVRADL